MFMMRSEKDRGVNTFSETGRLFQVEYAIEAIKLGSTALGIQTPEGVILGAEKRITSSLLEVESVHKILEIDSHIGCAMSGIVADALTLIEHARVETQYHRFTYDEPMTTKSCAQSICDLSIQFGERSKKKEKIMSRPFGVALLLAGIDFEEGKKVPKLYHTDPSGTFVQYLAKAIGAGSEGAQTTLQDEYYKSMSLKEAEDLIVKILKQVMEEKVTNVNVEILAITTEQPVVRLYEGEEIQGIIERVDKKKTDKDK